MREQQLVSNYSAHKVERLLSIAYQREQDAAWKKQKETLRGENMLLLSYLQLPWDLP